MRLTRSNRWPMACEWSVAKTVKAGTYSTDSGVLNGRVGFVPKTEQGRRQGAGGRGQEVGGKLRSGA